MSKRAWMPLYVGDYLGDTGHLTTVQHGAYFLLMMHYWRKGGLPDDDKQLAAIAKLPPRIWLEIRETLRAFFYDEWKHKRIDAELAKMQTLSDKRAQAGLKGGIRSAIGRARLEDAASRPSNSQPIAKQLLAATSKQLLQQKPSNCSSFAQAELDHSHSHKNITTTVSEDTAKGLSEGGDRKPPSQASKADLEALFAKRRAGAT